MFPDRLLGAQLLQRSCHGVRPTAASDTLTRHARLTLFQVEQMRGELRRLILQNMPRPKSEITGR
jgi:DNA-binding transcriptional LysR family regulator